MRIEHVAMWCADLEAQRRFYQHYFDAEASDLYCNSDKGFESYFLTFASGARLELMRQTNITAMATTPTLGLAHLAFSLGSKDAVDRIVRQFQADGQPLMDGPRMTGDGYYEAVILDPENNRVELTQ